LEEADEAALARLSDAFDALLTAPCHSFADVQAKATTLLAPKTSFGQEMQPEETDKLLRSFLPGHDAGAALS
jgi:hypothetical protein